MFHGFHRVLPCLLLVAGWVQGLAAGWNPIPAETWAIREDAARGHRDAVVLEKRTIFSNNQIETVYRVRVFSEAGKRAAELVRFSRDCHHISGRTVYPDGRFIEYSQVRDFQPVAAAPAWEEAAEPRIMPKGVTADCIVEVRWQESTWKKYSSPLPRRLGSFAEWELGGPYATLSETLELVEAFKWRTNLLPGRLLKPEVTLAGGYRIIRFTNLPAIETVPFSLPPLVDRPRFQVFDLPKVLYERAVKGIDDFWKAVMIVPLPKLITRDRIGTGSDRTMNTSRVFKDLDPSVRDSFVGFVRKGSAYRALARELLEGLPTAPQARAQALLRRLAARVVNSREVTFEEDENEREDMEEQDRIRTGPENIEEAVRTGRTNAKGMQILCFQLLKEAGLRPSLALLVNRQVRLFNYNAPIAWQFTDRLLGVEEPGKDTLWLDPARKYLPPGVVHPGLQGAEGLLVDTDAWTFRKFQLPFQPADAQRRRFEYQATLGAAGTAYRVQASFGGFSACEKGLRYLKLEHREWEPATRRDFEQAAPGLVVAHVEVLNANPAQGPVVWTIEGSQPLAAVARRSIDPFPGLPPVLKVQEALPLQRTTPIVLPSNALLEATCTLLVPAGSRLVEVPAFQRSNGFGSVAWTLAVRSSGGQVQATVRYLVQVNAVMAFPQAYDELKTFLDWIQEAEHRTVQVEKD